MLHPARLKYQVLLIRWRLGPFDVGVCLANGHYAEIGIMKRIVCAGLGWRIGSNQAHCSRALRIQLIELNRGGAYGV
jgi:hypothetical protein